MIRMEQLIRFEKRAIVENYSRKTIKTYKNYINGFVIWNKGKLEQEKINDYLYYLREIKKASVSSVLTARYALLYFFTKVLKQHIIFEIYKPKRKKSLPNPIDRQDIKAMLDAEKDLEKLTILELTYSSGMRCSEVAKAKWEHIDFKNNRIRVDEGKGDKDRITLLSCRCKENLLKLFSGRELGNQHIFTNKVHRGRGWHISDHTVYNTVKNSAKKAGLIINAYTHRLRHSFGTHLIEDGVPEKYVQELMGHTSPQTTEGYIKVAKHRLLRVKSPLDNLDKGIAYEKEVAEGAKLNAKVSI